MLNCLDMVLLTTARGVLGRNKRSASELETCWPGPNRGVKSTPDSDATSGRSVQWHFLFGVSNIGLVHCALLRGSLYVLVLKSRGIGL